MIITERLPYPSGIVCDCGNRATLRVTVHGTSADVCRPCKSQRITELECEKILRGKMVRLEAIIGRQQTCTPEQRAAADAGAEMMLRASDHLDLMGQRVTIPGAPIVALLRDLAKEARSIGPNPHGVELARRILGVELYCTRIPADALNLSAAAAPEDS
jgi:hypothetical protein